MNAAEPTMIKHSTQVMTCCALRGGAGLLLGVGTELSGVTFRDSLGVEALGRSGITNAVWVARLTSWARVIS